MEKKEEKHVSQYAVLQLCCFDFMISYAKSSIIIDSNVEHIEWRLNAGHSLIPRYKVIAEKEVNFRITTFAS